MIKQLLSRLKLILAYLWSHPAILICLIALVYLGKLIFFISINPQYYYFWDWPGHIDKAIKLGWPWQGGWDTTFWGGYPTLAYPSFSHYLLKLCLILASQKNIGIYGFTIFVFLIQIHSFYIFSRFMCKRDKFKLLVCFTSLLLLSLTSQSKYLGSFFGTLYTGGFSANLAMSFMLYLLSTSNPYLQAIFLGLQLLTHTFTASLSLFYLMVLYLFNFYLSWRKRSPFTHVNYLLPIVAGLCLGAPIILPMIDPTFAGTAFNASGSGTGINLLILSLLMGILYVENRQPLDHWLLLLVAMTGLSLIPEPWFNQLRSTYFINGVHLYRYYYPLLLIMVPHIIQLLPKSMPPTRYTSQLILISLMIFMIGRHPLPQSTGTWQINNLLQSSNVSRVIDAASTSDVMDYVHLIEHQLAATANQLGSIGLFFESSNRGLMFYELSNSINPNSYKNGTYPGYYDLDKPNRPTVSATEAANLLGVNYFTYVTDELPTASSSSRVVGTYTFNHNQNPPYYYVADPIPGVSLAHTIPYLPVYNPQLDLGSWWLNPQHDQLAVIKPLEVPPNVTFNSKPVQILSVSPATIDININSPEPVPVILKFTYSKYWQAIAMDSQSYSSKPYWVTPGNIFIMANGRIHLVWLTPSYIALGYLVSALSFLFLCLRLTKKGSRVTPLTHS